MNDHYAALQALKNQAIARKAADQTAFFAATGMANNPQNVQRAKTLENRAYRRKEQAVEAFNALPRSRLNTIQSAGYSSSRRSANGSRSSPWGEDDYFYGHHGMTESEPDDSDEMDNSDDSRGPFRDSEAVNSGSEGDAGGSRPAPRRPQAPPALTQDQVFPALALPAETQKQIFSFLSRRDLALTARASRASLALAGETLYKRVEIAIYAPWQKELLPPKSRKLLRTIETSRELRRLIKHLALKWEAPEIDTMFEEWDVDEETQREAGPYGDDWADDLEQSEAIDSVEVLRPLLSRLAGQLESFEAVVEDLTQDRTAELLRGLVFPNVRTLSLGQLRPSVLRLFPSVEAVSGKLVKLSQAGLSNPAPSLRSLTIRSSGSGNTSPLNAAAFRWLTSTSLRDLTSLTIPSIPAILSTLSTFTSLTSLTLTANSSNEKFPAQFPRLPPSLEHLALVAPSASNAFTGPTHPHMLFFSFPPTVQHFTIPLHLFGPNHLLLPVLLPGASLKVVELVFPRR